jgi:2-polyprenyl-6-hydroxyphenyl methylase/3-demethylubiquinone-9 3-methyltransferase
MSVDQRHHLYGTYGAEEPHTHSYIWPPVLRRLSHLPAGSRVLDAGCGNGTFARRLASLGFDVCGIDLAESGIAQARRLSPGSRFEIASVYDDLGELFGRPFDAVVSLETVEHLYDPRTFVGRVRDGLRPGGLFVVSTPYHGYLKNLALAVTGRLDAHFTALWDGGHVKFWSRRTLTALLTEKGFRVTECLGAGRLPYFWKSMILVARRP